MNKLIMMVGFSGSEKTQFLQNLRNSMRNTVIHSYEGIRKELYGDEEVQEEPRTVFDILHRRAIVDLQSGNNVIYDAPNLKKDDRVIAIKTILEKCPSIEKTVMYMAIEPDECKEVNENRPCDFRGYETKSESIEFPEKEEGFDQIISVGQKRLSVVQEEISSGKQDINLKQIKYVGIFFNKVEVYAKAGSQISDERLSRQVCYPHITLLYKPSQINYDLFGKKNVFTVIAYGNDGINEGFLVSWKNGDAEVKSIFDQITIPHITLSVSLHGKQINTRYLEYEKIEPFEIEGLFGGVTYGDELVIHCN